MVASAERADHRVFAPGLDMAKHPAVAALGRGGRWVGSFNHTVAAIKEDGGRIDHSVSMIRRDMNHDGASSLAIHAGEGIKVEVPGASNKKVLGIVYGGFNVREEEVVIIREGILWDAMDGKLEISRGQPEGEPGVVTNRKELVELQGEGLEERSVGGSQNSGVCRYEGDRAFVIDKGLEGDRKIGVSFVED